MILASGALAGRGLEVIGKFALYALAARRLGAADAGRFFLCLGAVHLIATLARMGLERPLTRHVAAERAVGAYCLARRTAALSTAGVLAASVGIAAALWIAAPVVATALFHDPALTGPLRAAALVLPAQNLAYAAAYVLIGLDRAGAAQLVMNTTAPCVIALVLSVWPAPVDVLLLIYALAFAASAMGGVAAIFSRPWDSDPSATVNAEPLGSIWRSALTLLPVELSQAALLSVPVMLVGVFASAQEVSAFSIASRVSMLIATVVISVGAMAAPAFARHHRRRAWSELRSAMDNARRLVSRLCQPLLAAMAILAWPVMGAMHAPLPTAARCLWVLLIGQTAYCLWPCQDTLLAMTGHAVVLRRLALIQVAVCLAASVLLIPVMGAMGAAIASAGVWTLGAAGCATEAKRLVWDAAPR